MTVPVVAAVVATPVVVAVVPGVETRMQAGPVEAVEIQVLQPAVEVELETIRLEGMAVMLEARAPMLSPMGVQSVRELIQAVVAAVVQKHRLRLEQAEEVVEVFMVQRH